MIESLSIQGYRTFSKYELSGLGRVNLLVGVNNSGKTSVLEALHLLTSRGDPTALWQVLWRCGERIPSEPDPRRPEFEADITHLFTGHSVKLGSKIRISAPEKSISFTVVERSLKESAATASGRPRLSSAFELHVSGNPEPYIAKFGLSPRGGIRTSDLDTLYLPDMEDSRSRLITTDSMDGDDLTRLWDNVQLTTNEQLVLNALKILDCNIERIASQSGSPYFYNRGSRGGFVVRQSNHSMPIPIGSLGEGVWRMLAMAISLTQCKDGVLLIDEIDTGLHYSIMADLWRLICSTAEALNVQVFATTHSYDCVKALASVSVVDPSKDITLQRIEIDKAKSVRYTRDELRPILGGCDLHLPTRRGKGNHG